MKAIILAAGFATRLYPLTLNKAKPLLEIKGKPLIDHIIEKINSLGIGSILVITNDKFYPDFLKWAANKSGVKILNDLSKTEEDRLGAVGDLLFSLENEKIDEDILVIAGDNFFEDSLEGAYNSFLTKNQDSTIFYPLENIEDAKRFGIALIDEGVISDFEEKPENPKSNLCSAATYFFKKETIPLIKEISKQKKDNLGSLISELYKIIPICAYISEGKWIDIGTPEALEEARKVEF